VPLLMRLLAHDRFVAGDLDTHFLDTEAAALVPPDSPPAADARAVAAIVRRAGRVRHRRAGADTSWDPWTSLGGRRV
jgi:acetyl/propionyl-CoA carboxylase alpha subunit